MELKEGYKQTEIGIIPEEWDLTSLDQISEVTSGKRLPPGWHVIAHRTPYPYIRVSDMFYGGVSTRGIMYVPEIIANEIKNYRIYKEDLFISVAGTLGIVGCIPEELDGANLTENADRISKIQCDKKFLLYILLSENIQKIIESIRTVGAQPKLALERIRKFIIPLPPSRREQKAIASALSDVDALLSSLDALIAKKRDIKTAAMQELLTGKKRLPGFSGSWKKAFAYEYGEFVRGVSYNPDRDLSYKNKENTFILLRANNINNNIINFSEIYYINKDIVDKNQILLDGDILFCMSNGSKRLVGKSASYGGSFSNAVTFGAFMGVLRPNSNSNKSFLKYIFQTNMFISYINIILAGSAINNLTPANILNFDFLIPTDTEEQAAIATILSDMDAEIAALVSRRAKVQSLKQGMMQELLTGRTRLLPAGE